MSADLDLAKQLLEDARQDNRELKDKFKSLCKAVDHIIIHLQSSERAKKAAKV
jgi:hypothetical protein